MDFSKLKNIADFYENNIFKKWMSAERMYYWDVSEREEFIDSSWQSNVSSGILKRITKTFNAHLYDNTISFNVTWNNENDNKKAAAVNFILTRAFQVAKTKPIMFEILNDALLLWEGYGRMEYDYGDEKVEFMTPTGKKSYTTKKKNNPKLRYVSPFDVMVDPWASSWEEARYIIERNVVSVDTINQKYQAFFEVNDKDIEKFKWNATYLFEKDYNMQKNKIMYDANWLQDIQDVNAEYTFDKNIYLEVVEVWTDTNLTIYVNWHKMYEDINPYPLKKKPYVQIMFSKENGVARWTWLYDLLKDVETTGNAVLNNYLDNLKLKTIPSFVRVTWPNLDSIDSVLDIAPWSVNNVEDPNALQPLNLGNANPQLLDTFQFLLQEAFMIAWVNEIVMGATLQKVDRSAASTMSRVQWFKTRMLQLFDSINDAMSDVAEMWLAMIIAYNAEWKENQIEAKVFDSTNKKTEFKKIKLEELEWQFDIIFDSLAMKNALKEIALQKQMQLFQVAWQLPTDPNTQKPIFDFTELAKNIVWSMDLSQDVLWNEKDAERIKEEIKKEQVIQWQWNPAWPQSWWVPNTTVDQMEWADRRAEQQAGDNETATDMLQSALNFN